jgi:exodeoxyribonuclease VIII
MLAHRRGEMGRDETDDLRFGRAMHHRILEPETFDESWPINPGCQAPIVKGPNARPACGNTAPYASADKSHWVCGVHNKADLGPAGDYITEDERERIEAIEQELHQAGQLARFRRPGWSEVVIEAELYGVKCKVRIDRLTADGGAIIDCKKCQPGHADQESFSKSVANYGYHIQAAFYARMVKQVFGDYPLFSWMIIEDKPPHCVNVIDASNFDLQAGRWEVQRVLEQWKQSTKSGVYHGVLREQCTVAGGLPKWERDRYARFDLGDSMLPKPADF